MLQFTESTVDPSLFILKEDDLTAFLFVYVDDIVVVGSDEKKVEELIKRLAREFPMRDLAKLNFFLSIQVEYFKDAWSHLSQTQYFANLLQSTDWDDLKRAPTSMITNIVLKSEGHPVEDSKEYRWVIGLLQYMTLTRLDIQMGKQTITVHGCTTTNSYSSNEENSSILSKDPNIWSHNKEG